MRPVIAAMFAALGLYTIYAAPRSLPHWLAAGSATALAAAYVMNLPGELFTLAASLSIVALSELIVGKSGRRFARWLLFFIGAAFLSRYILLELSYVLPYQSVILPTVLVVYPALFILWRRVGKRPARIYILIAGVAIGLNLLLGSGVFDVGVLWVLLFYLYPMAAGGVSFLAGTSGAAASVRYPLRRIALLCLLAGIMLATAEYWANLKCFIECGLDVYPGLKNPGLHDLSAILSPALVALGVALTCFAIIRLVRLEKLNPASG